MTCQDCTDSLHAYVDEELSPEESAQVRSHLETCVTCARAYARIRDTSRLVKQNLVRHQAPDVLKARIRARIAADAPPATAVAPSRVRRWPGGWARAAAMMLVAATIASAATTFVMRRSMSESSLSSAVLASHIRSLMPGHLTDVASTDQHNVKPWFNGRVNLSPPVPRLDSAGFQLAGGRLDYIDGQPAAVVVYLRRQHVINVFWRTSTAPRAEAATGFSTENGYNAIRGQRDGLEYWIVSDLNRSELEDFHRRLAIE